jgi:hypothetical protein
VTLNAWNARIVLDAIGNGTGNAYATAYARYMGTVTRDRSFVLRSLAEASSLEGLDALRGSVRNDVAELGNHSAQMERIANKICAHLPSGQVQKAMDAYLTYKGPAWQAEDEALRAKVIKDGARLLKHMVALSDIARNAGLEPALLDQWSEIEGDPTACIAIKAALENDPKSIESEGTEAVLKLLELTPAGKGRLGFLGARFANIAATALVRETMMSSIEGFYLGDPASVDHVRRSTEALRNGNFARLLGVTEAELNQAIDLVQKSAVEVYKRASDAAVSQESYLKTIRDVEDDLEKIEGRLTVGAFARSTLAGQMMRGVSAAVLCFSFYTGLKTTYAMPDPVSILKSADQGLLALRRTCELLLSLDMVSASSVVGRIANLKVKGVPIAEGLLEFIAILEAVNGVRSAFGLGVPQDTGAAIASGASAVGFGLMSAPAFGAASWTGPVGIGITAAVVIVRGVGEGAKTAHQDEQAIEICLRAAGLNDVAAAALARQTAFGGPNPGQMQIPFLAKYAEHKHKSMVAAFNWINGRTPDQAKFVSDSILWMINQERLDRMGQSTSFDEARAEKPHVVYEPRIDVEMRVFDRRLARERIPELGVVSP